MDTYGYIYVRPGGVLPCRFVLFPRKKTCVFNSGRRPTGTGGSGGLIGAAQLGAVVLNRELRKLLKSYPTLDTNPKEFML